MGTDLALEGKQAFRWYGAQLVGMRSDNYYLKGSFWAWGFPGATL